MDPIVFVKFSFHQTGLFIEGSLNRTPLFSKIFDISSSVFILNNFEKSKISENVLLDRSKGIGNKEKLNI